MFLKISKFFLYASVFSVAVVLPSTFFPFIGGKYYFFRVAVELALASFILWWAFDPEGTGLVPRRLKELFRRPLFIAVSIFAAVFLLASIFAYDPAAAFWSNYERGDGGFQMLHYYFFFVLLTVTFREEKDWRKLFWFSSAAAALVILYGLLAAGLVSGFFGPYRETESIALLPSFLGRLLYPSSRFQGSLGNPAYVAPYLMFSIFYVLYLWWSAKNRLPRTAFGYGGLVLAFFLFFVLSQTRGAFFGLVAAIAAFFIFIVFFGDARLKKIGLGAVLVMVLSGVILFSMRRADFLNNFIGGRLLNLDFGVNTLQTRFWTWGSAWQGFKERPLLGWGPENFSAVFDKYFDPRHFTPGQNTETWFDRAHSIIFDYLAETGILGLAAFLGIWATFFFGLFKKAKICPPVLGALLFALPVGYFVQGLVLFDVLPIYMNIFIFLAFADYIFHKDAAAY